MKEQKWLLYEMNQKTIQENNIMATISWYSK